jgi:glycosyltransferase 2 family protein
LQHVSAHTMNLTPQPDLALPKKKNGLASVAIFILKLAVTVGCFWYLASRINFEDLLASARGVDITWIIIAIFLMAVQIILVGLRWRTIIGVLVTNPAAISRKAAIAIAAIGGFFGQVLPNVAGDTVRVVMVSRLGVTWRAALTSVLIDRAVGVLVLLAFGFVSLLLPSALTALTDARNQVLAVFGAILAASIAGLLLAPRVAPILESWPFTNWIGKLLVQLHRVIVASPAKFSIFGLACVVHALTIVAVWTLGRAQGLDFPLTDAAVLFTLIVAISLIPFTIGGWGIREVAVTLMLQTNGMSMEKALFFSVSFGFVMVVASLPGAVVWALYSPKQSRAEGEVGRSN